MYLIASILKILKVIENVHGAINLNKHDEEEADKRSVRALKNTLQKYYGVKEDDSDSKKIDDIIDSEAHKVDRYITLKKIEITKKGGSSFSDFFSAVKKLKLSKKIAELKSELEDKDNIKKLFPFEEDAITGLFVVSARGWRYIPADKIGEHVVITTISMGNPKIELK
jgi:hypothetical protein